MIPLVKENNPELLKLGIEKCYFGCGNNTLFWHWRTNQPICQHCAKIHKVSEVEKCTPKYKPPTKKEYMESINR